MIFFKNKNSLFLENFIEYLNNPNPTTTLVFCLKNKKLDKRSKIYKSIEKNAVVLDTDSKETKFMTIRFQGGLIKK